MDIAHYQRIVGSLSYADNATRPDVAFAVSALSCYSEKPHTAHLRAAKRVLRYLKYTADLKLVFPRTPTASKPLVGFTDSDIEGDIDGRKSQGGYSSKPTTDQSRGSHTSRKRYRSQPRKPNT